LNTATTEETKAEIKAELEVYDAVIAARP